MMDSIWSEGTWFSLVWTHGFSFCYYVVYGTVMYWCWSLAVMYYEWKTTPLNEIPGPNHDGESSFWVGSFVTILREPFMSPHERWWKKANLVAAAASGSGTNKTDAKDNCGRDGDSNVTVPFIYYSSLLGKPSVVVFDPDVVKEIALTTSAFAPSNGVGDGNGYVARFEKYLDFVVDRIGNGLITLEGMDWVRHRKIIQPSFHTTALKESVCHHTNRRVRTFLSYWSKRIARNEEEQQKRINNNKSGDDKNTSRERTGEEGENGSISDSGDGRPKCVVIDALSHLSALTLDILGDVALSYDFQALDVIAEWAEDDCKDNSYSGNPDVSSSSKSSVSSSRVVEIRHPIMQVTKDMKPNVLSLLLMAVDMNHWEKYLSPALRRSRKWMDDIVDDILRNASSTGHCHGEEEKNKKPKSLLELLFEAERAQRNNDDEKNGVGDNKNIKKKFPPSFLSRTELRDEVKTFVSAGHETTATWCYWCLFALAMYPEVQDKVHRDIEAILGDGDAKKEDITLELIDENMTYYDAFLKEVLRFYPPLGMTIRQNNKTEHWKGYTIPPHTRLVIPMHLLHRHSGGGNGGLKAGRTGDQSPNAATAKYWKEDPDVFMPERWIRRTNDHDGERAEIGSSGGGSGSKLRDYKPYTNRFVYVPFFAGGRSCIGERFANMEVKLIVANIVRDFRVSFDEEQERNKASFQFTTVGTTVSKPKLRICIHERN